MPGGFDSQLHGTQGTQLRSLLPVFPMELALLATDLSLQCGQLWTALDTALDTALLSMQAIASVSVQLLPWLSVESRTLLIKTLGRWQSAAYTVYIRTPRETLCAVAQSLISPASGP